MALGFKTTSGIFLFWISFLLHFPLTLPGDEGVGPAKDLGSGGSDGDEEGEDQEEDVPQLGHLGFGFA